MELKSLLSFGYWFSALSLGLLLHPYATLRKMVRDRLLRPLVLLPMVSAVALWAVTVIVVHMGAVIMSGVGWTTPGVVKQLLALMFWWGVWFLGLWQVVLVYLFARFMRVLG